MLSMLQSKWAPPAVGGVLFLVTMLTATVQVMKEIKPPPAPVKTEEAATTTMPVNYEFRAPGPSWTYINPEMDVLLEELRTAKTEMTSREEDLLTLEARVQSEQAELQRSLADLTAMQQEFDQFLVQIKTEETRHLMKLARVFSTMPPDEAVAILREMGDSQLAKIMVFMKDYTAATILSLLAQDGTEGAIRVAQLSELLRKALIHRKIPEELQEKELVLAPEDAERFRQMATLYSGMPAGNAAAILREMDDSEVATLLMFMPKGKSSPILAALSTQGNAGANRASEISGKMSEAYDDPQSQQVIHDTQLVIKADESDQLKKLSKVYNGMPPTNALSILEEMDDYEFAKILYFIQDTQKAQILSMMTQNGKSGTQRATIISDLLGSIQVAAATPIP